MSRKIYFLLFLILCLSFSLSACDDETDENSIDKKSTITSSASEGESWVFYWYLCGSDLESEYGCASLDLEELGNVTLPENVTVVFEAGGASTWYNDFDPEVLTRGVYNFDGMQILEELPSANMGDPEVLADFLSYCKTNNLKFEFDNEGKRIVRWFKKLFIEEFGLDIEFSLFFKSRIMKYTKEYEYFYTLFKNSKLKEVFIPSAYWSAGIVSAAKNCGIVVSDIQYALISKYHPSFAFPVSARAYGSDRVYLWSKYWNIKEVPYNKSFVLETNYLKEKLMNFGELNNLSVKYDIAFIGQSRIGRKLFNIALDYAKLNKDKNIVFCPHPDEMVELYARYQEINGLDNLNISEKFQDTLEAILLSKNIVGVYSTSLIEAAALNKKVFSIKLSGHEVLEREVEKGCICYIVDINDLNNKILSNFVSNNPDVSNLYDNEFIKMEIEA